MGIFLDVDLEMVDKWQPDYCVDEVDRIAENNAAFCLMSRARQWTDEREMQSNDIERSANTHRQQLKATSAWLANGIRAHPQASSSRSWSSPVDAAEPTPRDAQFAV